MTAPQERTYLESRTKADLIVAAIQGKRAVDISVLDLRGLTIIADYFVIATAPSPVNMKAQIEAARDAVDEPGTPQHRIEGQADSGWMLADLGDVVLHVFDADQRDFYQLERLWMDAPRIAVAAEGAGQKAEA
jgi:ribosome-associated protein